MSFTLSHRQKIVAIILLNFVLCLPGLWVPFYNRDELTNTLYARFINLDELGLRDFLGNPYLMSHYLYALVYRFVSPDNFIAMHLVQALWRSGTCLAMFWAGTQLDDKRTGCWAALFYCVCSTCFLSKDFHSPGAESLSLLPAALCAGFLFKGIRLNAKVQFFCAGTFAALACFCKAPMGLTIVAILISLCIQGKRRVLNCFMVCFGFLIVFIIPLLLVWPPQESVKLLIANVTRVNDVYLQTFSSLSFFYLFAKYFIRLFLILGASCAMSSFAIFALRGVFDFRALYPHYWQKVFFLFVWFILLCFAVSLGGRMFFHYYLFLFAPLPLLAASGIKQYERLMTKPGPALKKSKLVYLSFVRRYIVVLMFVPALAFFIEGALNVSTRPEKINSLVDHIRTTTEQNDRIYVWGYMPQIYFFSERLPSTVYFWTEFLAGTSPGTHAMEYVRATGKSLDVATLIQKDFDLHALDIQDPKDYMLRDQPSKISENDLFTVEEILQRISQPYWQKVFADFLRHPPKLFIDTSPLNAYAFGHYPIQNYELLKRFILDNYTLDTKVDGIIVYRLKSDAL